MPTEGAPITRRVIPEVGIDCPCGRHFRVPLTSFTTTKMCSCGRGFMINEKPQAYGAETIY